MRLDKKTRDRLKLYRKATKAERKLQRRKNATYQQKNSWKCTLAKAMREFPTHCEGLMTPTMKVMGFLPQVVLFGYIADFAHPEKRIVVEVDGSAHEGKKDYDNHRDDVFRSHGWTVLRVTNREVSKHPESVYGKVKALLA